MLAGHFDPDRARHAPASAVVIEASEGAAAARSGSVHCVFEGHVFHDAGLARELHHQVDSDAELVARAYARHGVRMLDGIRGSFAFVAWDEETGRGIVAQDQIGTRTIYLATDGSRLVFASEVIDLLRCLPRRPAPDGHSISHLLFGGGQLPDRSLYEGVRPLRGAHVVEMGPDGWHARRYWEPSFEGTLDLPRPELAEQLREKVEQSVRRRIENHTPGILLSGGLDSSVVASIAAPIAADDSPLRTYSCVFPGEPDYDESARIESLTSTLPVIGNHFLLEPQGSFSLSLRHLERWGFPGLAPGSLVETPPLAYAAADGVDVMLDGQGGDEVFGVSAYLMADRLASGRLMSAVRLA
ncbi:MAG: hypothetical protein QOJ57_2617, partial [Thermoleophilaceae bacterium]|nr:hypothetical protein [Thermoleophilaceae bacterium]